jgi:hypothetical protein
MWLSVRKRCRRQLGVGSLHSIKIEESLVPVFQYYILTKGCCHIITEIKNIKNVAEEIMDHHTYWSLFVFC